MSATEIRLQRTLEHTPEKVWRALTDPEALGEWLMANDFEPRVGHRFRFEHKAMPGWRGFVECEVLEVEPPRLLSYTWLGDEDWTQPTIVRWSLEPVAGGTLLKLEHTGFEEPWGPEVAKMLESGWGKKLTEQLVETLDRMETPARR